MHHIFIGLLITKDGKMNKDHKVQITGMIEGISTRVDNTIKIVLGSQELPVEKNVALFSMNRVPVNILISPHEITQEDLESVDVISEEDKEHFGRKAKTKAQRQRNILFRVWESEGSKGTSKEYYDKKMNEIAEHLIEKYLD